MSFVSGCWWRENAARAILLLVGVESLGLVGVEGNVNDTGAGNGVVIRNRGVVLDDDDVRSAVSELSGDSDGEAVSDLDVVNVEAGEEGGVLAGLDTVTRKGQGLALALVTGVGKRGEGSDGEGGVAVRARGDEGSSERVGLVEAQRGVEDFAETVTLLDGGGNPRSVTSLDSQDGASGGKVSTVGDVLGGTEVSADTDTLKKGRGGDKGLDVGNTESVSALSGGLVSESLGEEVNVSLLVSRDLDESLSDPVGVSGGAESTGIVGGKRVTVEGVLEVLEGKSVVEDDNVNVSLAGGGPLLNGGRGSGHKGGAGSSKNSELGQHCEKVERREGLGFGRVDEKMERRIDRMRKGKMRTR